MSITRLWRGWTLPENGTFAVFPAARHRPQKIRAFVDALKLHVESHSGTA